MELSDILLIKPEHPLICIIKNFDYTKKIHLKHVDFIYMP